MKNDGGRRRLLYRCFWKILVHEAFLIFEFFFFWIFGRCFFSLFTHLFSAIYEGYTSIYNWIRGPPCSFPFFQGYASSRPLGFVPTCHENVDFPAMLGWWRVTVYYSWMYYVKELTQELTQERFRLFGSRWKWLIVFQVPEMFGDIKRSQGYHINMKMEQWPVNPEYTHTHPKKLTWNLNMPPWKSIKSFAHHQFWGFQLLIFRGMTNPLTHL